MKQASKLSTKRTVIAALMAALTVVGSALRIKLPLSIAGTASFHLGNIMCALSGLLLGPWLGGFAAGLGSALYDIILDPSYISECWITFLTKGLYGLIAGLAAYSGTKELGYGKALLSTLAGAVSYAVIYLAKSYFYNGLFLLALNPSAAWLTVIGKLPATIFNGAVAVIFAPILAVAIRNALRKNHLSLE